MPKAASGLESARELHFLWRALFFKANSLSSVSGRYILEFTISPPNFDKNSPLVVAAVIERQGRLLICRRPAHKRHGHLWEFPGGKLEPGESLADAAARELKEELDLALESCGEELFRMVDEASGLTICFIKVIVSGEPRLLEHAELSWVEPASLGGYDLAPSDSLFAAKISRS